jgi:hypothetical protein
LPRCIIWILVIFRDIRTVVIILRLGVTVQWLGVNKHKIWGVLGIRVGTDCGAESLALTIMEGSEEIGSVIMGEGSEEIWVGVDGAGSLGSRILEGGSEEIWGVGSTSMAVVQSVINSESIAMRGGQAEPSLAPDLPFSGVGDRRDCFAGGR